ncbi:MAG TPA: DUF4389 domain-containing protein [Solirubrobacterales bacterium]
MEERSRSKTGFRFILVIPWFLLGSVFILGAFIVAFLAWFAIIFTGRYPEGLYSFNAGVIRFVARTYGFTYLQTDEWPPFGFEEAPDYPIRTPVGPRSERYSRWKTGFRFIVGIPAFFILYLLGYVWPFAAVVAWFHIVFRGHSSGGTHNVISWGLAYQLRATAYFLLMTDTLPPISEQEPLTSA